MKNSRKPDESDRAKGQELAQLRKAVGLSQEKVAIRLGISAKQFSKYELGQNRIPAGRYEAALKILREYAGLSGFEEGQSPYAPPKPEKEALLRCLGAFESDLKSCQDRLKLCFEIVGRW
jgi:transcriptional regulator with XRE-family HTH domain